ncbi:hypothetical protein IFM89_009084 [Coptis chinensis]|uniref:DUF8039 domain-containing protein n=1 Tax=Coptis chinensis TaxID=261450 RepID=A0A835IP37_9MAGN|nr:hypothetical protein IFM89_009084 [Coptis chinensis]
MQVRHIFGASTSSSKETRDEPKEEVDHFITKLGHIARRDIPIHYDSWKPVRSHESIIPKASKTLGRMYVFENIDTIDTDWTIRKFQKAWKEYKHELFKKYVKDQPPSFVREHPKQGIPLQDWRQFVDNCNSEKFKVNGFSVLFHESVAKVEMAKEKGVPVSSITRLDQYMHNHKRKNGEHQDPELVEKLNDYTALHPESRETSVNDALTKVVNEYIGKECDLRGGWPLRVVARGIVQDINPNTEFGNRRLEEGNFKVHVNVVYDGGAVLPLPHDDWRSKLGEVAQGSVIWPKELLML